MEYLCIHRVINEDGSVLWKSQNIMLHYNYCLRDTECAYCLVVKASIIHVLTDIFHYHNLQNFYYVHSGLTLIDVSGTSLVPRHSMGGKLHI